MLHVTKCHIFQILTKRPERMNKILKFWNHFLDDAGGLLGELQTWYLNEYKHRLPHLWVGVTAENQKTANERIPILLKTPAAVRFVSVEPMLEPINLCHAQGFSAYVSGGGNSDLPLSTGIESNGIDWLINGGETGCRTKRSNKFVS